MAFVRVKNIKGRKYSYLVENEWTPWGSRQRVTKYLGKTHELARLSDKQQTLPIGLNEALLAAVAQELSNHGFVEKEGTFVNETGVTVDLKTKKVNHKEKDAVLGMNEGYLCGHTLAQLLAFAPEERPDKTAAKLANLCLEAGLKLNNEQFIHIFEQVKQP